MNQSAPYRLIQGMLQLLRQQQLWCALVCLMLLVSPQLEAHAASSFNYADDRPPTAGNYEEAITEEEDPADADPLPYTYYYTYRTDTGGNTAFQSLCADGDFITRIVTCVRTFIDGAVEDFLDKFALALNGYILSLIILAVILFGLRILTGTSEKPGVEATQLLIRIGGVLLFTNMLGGFVGYILPSMEAMASYAMSYMSSGSGSILMHSCSEAGLGSGADSIWTQVDCILRRLVLGQAGFNTSVLWVLAVALFWTSFMGLLVFFLMITVLVTILLLVLRCVYIFLSSYALISLLIIISPLIIPLCLFGQTKPYFEKWLKHFMSLMMVPVILFAYMTFVFALIDSMFFQENDYSLSSILGVTWEDPYYNSLSDDEIATKMGEFKDNTGYNEDSEEYKSYQGFLQNSREYAGVGNVNIEEEPLVNIEVNFAQDIAGAIDLPGQFLDDAAETIAGWTDDVIEGAFNTVARHLIPFKVPRIQGDDRSIMDIMWDLLKFCVVLLVITPLMFAFTKRITEMAGELAGAGLVVGQYIPGERQAIGTVGAAKGATTGAVKGAAVGFVTGGKAGAVKGAVEGGVRGGVSGYRNAVKDTRSSSTVRSSAGAGREHDIMAKAGGNAQRNVIHGEGGGGGGIMGRGLGAAKGFAKEAGMQALTRGRGGKGGGGGAGKGGGGSVPRK